MATLFMWLFVVVLGVLGLIALVVPGTERRIVDTFVSRGPVRFLGLVLLAAGILLFVNGDHTGSPHFVHFAGVVGVLAGGVSLVLPDTMIVFNEWWLTRGDWTHRASGLIYLVAAALFYTATGIPPESPADLTPQ